MDRPPFRMGKAPQQNQQQRHCPTSFTTLHSSKPIRRSAWTRGIHTLNSNNRRARTEHPEVIEDLQASSNSWIQAVPCSQRTRIPNRVIACALRSRFQEPHLPQGCRFHSHHCSRTSDRKLDNSNCSHLEICSGLGGLIAPHNEVVSALKNIIAASGLAKYDTIHLERPMSDHGKHIEEDDPEVEDGPSKSYSDLTFQTAEGETVHVDVSIVHSASKAVKEATRRSTQGYYNLLRQRERAKLKTAQSWLSIPELSEVQRSHEQVPMEEDLDTRAEPSTRQSSSASASPFNGQMSQLDIVLPEDPVSRPLTNPGVPPTYKDASNDGKRRHFIPFVLSSTGRLDQAHQSFLRNSAKKRGNEDTTSQLWDLQTQIPQW